MNIIFNRLLKIALPPQFVVENDQKMIQNLTFNNIFEYIKSEHWHQTKKHTCPHSESLYDHLLSCADICYEIATKEGYTKKECVKAYLTGLLHDIGKPGTRRLLGKHTAFKGHGLVGGAMLENFYSKELLDEFSLSEEDWADISTCADVHMCSYFPQHTSKLHRYSVNILPESIKRMLLVLREGDQLSMIPDKTYPKSLTDIIKDVKNGEEQYRRTLFEEMSFSDLDKKKGILILIQGGSSCGKTTFANNLLDKFGKEKCTYVNRDWYIVHWTVKLNKDMGEDEEKFIITPSLYQRCYQKYLESNKKWASKINEHMKRDIFEGLQRGNIVIVDTLATMFDSIEQIIPEIAKESYRISFWLHRNTLISENETSNRLGMDMKNALNAHGETTLYNPYNIRINWHKSICGSENDSGNNDWHLQTHLSLSYGWTGIKNTLLSYLCDKILKMYSYNQSIPRVPVLEQTYHLSLEELVQTLKDMNGIEDFFKQYSYTVSKYIPNVVGIKYIDGANQIWQPKWAREARGRFYYIGEEKVVPLKDTLQRGIEVLTKAHLDGGVKETQDIDENSVSKLDKNQADIMKILRGVSDFNSFLTGKVDGSLLIVNIYPKSCKQYRIIKQLREEADKFTKTIIDYCIYSDFPIVTISTQGTLFIGEEMQDYFLTSIEDVVQFKATTFDDWNIMVSLFVSKVLDYYRQCNLDNTEMVNMCFESYCKNRITFTNRLHTELAVGYDHSGINLLGIMNKGRYIPHFDLPRKVFKQPFYYHVQKTTDVYRLMSELDEVVLGVRSLEQFLQNFIIDEYTSKAIHPEGFVLLTPILNKDYIEYDYSKIKTSIYYKCHKVRSDKIKELLLLPEICGEYYPILRNLHKFFNNSGTTIKKLVQESYEAITNEINKTSVFYTKQNIKAQKRIDEFIENPTDNDKKKVVYKIILNNRLNISDIQKLFSQITYQIYQCKTEEMIEFTKNLLMKVEPWSSGWEIRLEQLFSTFDDTVNSLYNLVITN